MAKYRLQFFTLWLFDQTSEFHSYRPCEIEGQRHGHGGLVFRIRHDIVVAVGGDGGNRPGLHGAVGAGLTGIDGDLVVLQADTEISVALVGTLAGLVATTHTGAVRREVRPSEALHPHLKQAGTLHLQTKLYPLITNPYPIHLDDFMDHQGLVKTIKSKWHSCAVTLWDYFVSLAGNEECPFSFFLLFSLVSFIGPPLSFFCLPHTRATFVLGGTFYVAMKCVPPPFLCMFPPVKMRHTTWRCDHITDGRWWCWCTPSASPPSATIIRRNEGAGHSLLNRGAVGVLWCVSVTSTECEGAQLGTGVAPVHLSAGENGSRTHTIYIFSLPPPALVWFKRRKRSWENSIRRSPFSSPLSLVRTAAALKMGSRT